MLMFSAVAENINLNISLNFIFILQFKMTFKILFQNDTIVIVWHNDGEEGQEENSNWNKK